MTNKPDCEITTTNHAIEGYLEGFPEGNGLADDLDKLINLCQRLKRDTTCLVTIKYVLPEVDEP